MKKITAYKGFDKDFKCREFQFEIGKTYTHKGKVKVCLSGFHATVHPLQCLKFYKEDNSRYALVELSDVIDKSQVNDDGKLAGKTIKIIKELTFEELCDEGNNNLSVGGSLYLRGTKITKIPKHLISKVIR